jgi:cytosine/adenosine deaminase-related metal-dependent hydrolase
VKRTLVRGATLITLDDALGDLARGDLLVEDDRIAAIAPRIEDDAAEIIDASGCIAIPGLVNAHMHTWQTALRGVAANWTLLEYFRKMHAGLATLFRPDDLYIATLVGALNQLNCGTTTLGDWCHNNPTPAHNDAALQALVESGIRAVFLHGTPKPDPKPGERPFWETPHPVHELQRLQAHWLPNRPQLSIGAAILGPHYSTLEVALGDFRMARDLDVIASMHQGGGPARAPDGWERLEQAGLLGDHVNIVHGHALSDEQLRRFVELGISFSVAPENEMIQGHGHPITGRLLALGCAPSLGVDLESTVSGEMLVQARVALNLQRSLNNVAFRAQHGTIPPTSTVDARQALRWATLEGARALKLDDRVGSLAAGKQADLVLIDASTLNMQPVHDPVATVVMQTSLANVRDVMVAGQLRKRGGRLLYDNVDTRLGELAESGRRIAAALDLVAHAE